MIPARSSRLDEGPLFGKTKPVNCEKTVTVGNKEDRRRMGSLHSLDEFRGFAPKKRRNAKPLYFSRQELMQLLNVYSKRVAQGEWRDYAIDHEPGLAVFSIFRHTCEQPLYSVVKTTGTGPKAQRQTLFQVFNGRHRMARSASLEDALSIFERKLTVVS